jgi:uncharacterized protein DUF3383
MSNVDQLVTLTEIASLAATAQPSFGTAMLISGSTSGTWTTPEKTRQYTTLAAVLTDFGAHTPEYLWATAYFSQAVTPSSLTIGRINLDPYTMDIQVVPLTAINSTVYAFTIGGCTPTGTLIPATNITYTSDGSATLTEIVNGLVAAITAASLTGISASNLSTTIAIAGTAGTWYWVSLTSTTGVKYGPEKGGLNLFSMASYGPDTGTTTAVQLTAIAAEDNTWYAIGNPYQSLTLTPLLAAFAETNKKVYAQVTSDTAVSTHALSGATDQAAVVQSSSYNRTSIWYHELAYQFADAALYGAWLPLTPGADDSAERVLVGVTTSNLTDTQMVNIAAKNANFYILIGAQGATRTGKMAGQTFLEVRREVDSLVASLQLAYANVLQERSRTPMDDIGFAIVAASQRQVLKTSEVQKTGFGIIESGWTLFAPKRADLAPADISAGLYQGMVINAVPTIPIKKGKVSLVLTLT